MFTNVLVGVDGRTTGRDAIDLARELVEADGRLTLAHVRDGRLAGVSVEPEIVRAANERSWTLLRDESARAGVVAQLASVVADTPGHGLHQQAEAQKADLLVVGSCHRGTIGRTMLGDDTRAALNGAPCAIALAPAGYAETRRGPIAGIGVAFDGSPESMNALAVARDLAGEHHATVHALQVVSLPSLAYGGYVGEAVEAMLGEARARLGELPGVEGRAVEGLPDEELAQFGDEVDLLVVGSRGYGPMRRLVFGSTANYLERHARCPLLVLPRSAGRSDAAPERDRDSAGAAA